MIDGHGDDAYKYAGPVRLNFSSNVYGRLQLEPLWQHLSGCLSSGLLGSYPEPEPYTLERELAHRAGLLPEQVLVTNGATEAIYLIAQTFREARTAILQPTFSEYADACRMNDHRLSALYQLPTSADGWRLPADVGVMWLCNPNNPTGHVVDAESLEQMFRANPRVVFVVDQSYEAFTTSPLLTSAEAAQHPNVFLLHSLTKRYALPGIRLGYVTGNEFLLDHLRAHRMPWSVNAMAIEAGRFLTAHPEVAQLNLTQCLDEAQALRQALEQTGAIEVWPTQTHYMLCRLTYGKAAALKDYLAEQHGILIRDASNFQGLDEHYFRVASQGRDENHCLVDGINTWLAE